MQRIYLIRHGRTVANEHNLCCGKSDVPLSPEGLSDLHRLAAGGGYPDPEGKRLIDEMMATARASRGAVTKEVKRTEAMERMLYRNTVIGLIKQAGGAITEEMALELNQKLRQIPKQDSREEN